MKHKDFSGNTGTIKTGDLQWMTAGKGIVHSEMPAAVGTQRGLQLWINLSSENKMSEHNRKEASFRIQQKLTLLEDCRIEPRYQEMKRENIACLEREGVEVRVIAGESMGIKSLIRTKTPAMYLDFVLKPSAHVRQPVPATWNSFVYVLEGEGVFGKESSAPSGAHNILLLGHGDGLEAWNRSEGPLRFVLIGGEPLGEPVAQLGPFVMNTDEEIDRAVEDFERCVNGFEKARYWS